MTDQTPRKPISININVTVTMDLDAYEAEYGERLSAAEARSIVKDSVHILGQAGVMFATDDILEVGECK